MLPPSIQSIFYCSPAFVLDPEISPFTHSVRRELKCLYLIRTFFRIITFPVKLLSVLLFPPVVIFENVQNLSKSSNQDNIVLWEKGLWNNNVLSSVPPGIASQFNSFSTYKYVKTFSPGLSFDLICILKKLLVFSFSFSWQYQKRVHIFEHFLWVLSFSWVYQYSLWCSFREFLNLTPLKKLYYPLEMFADSRIIWSAVHFFKPDVLTYTSLHTSFTNSRLYFKGLPYSDSSFCPSYLVVPHASIKEKLKRFDYPGNILVGYTPRLSNFAKKKIPETCCLDTLDELFSADIPICILFNALLFDKLNFLVKFLQYRLQRSSALSSPLIFKLHPNDSQFIVWSFIFRVLSFGLNFKILGLDSVVPSSECLYLSVGSYYGYCLHCIDYKVYFLSSSYPTFLDPRNDLL